MNAYQKQLIQSKVEFLDMEEREIESNITRIKEHLAEQEEKLAKVRKEKAALQE